jgi:MFS transporter, PAT family, beta-lactamase induction signal transducer AmpG
MSLKLVLTAFTRWQMAVILLLGFSSGIPLALTGGTLQAWMASEKVDLTTIGLFALVGLPYTMKFLWSPLMDRFMPPFLGRRRGWIFISQLGLIAAVFAMAGSNPVEAPMTLAALALMVAFFSASQDIVVDAYINEALKQEELGIGSGLYIMGYRVAMLTSGALALILSDHIPWRAVYLIMAACVSVGVLASLFAPEPEIRQKPPKNLKDAVIQPFVEYLTRRGALGILAFIVLYKLGDTVAGAMTTPFMISVGFSKTDIGSVQKIFGMICTVVGALSGGALMMHLGMKRSLWIFGILQAVSNLAFMFLAQAGKHYPLMVATIGFENLCGGLGTAAFVAFMRSLCDKRFTATQYALLTSFMAQARVILSSPTGALAKSLGWEQYFLVSTFLAVPGLLLLTRFNAWSRPAEQPAESAAPATLSG